MSQKLQAADILNVEDTQKSNQRSTSYVSKKIRHVLLLGWVRVLATKQNNSRGHGIHTCWDLESIIGARQVT